MVKEDAVYIYTMKYYSATRKKKMLPFVTAWMYLEDFTLSETGQTGEPDTAW